MAPGKHELPGRGPGTDDADHECSAVAVGIDQPFALAGLKGQGTVARVAPLEQRVRLPSLTKLGGETSESFSRLAGDSHGHENPQPIRAHGAR